MEEISHVLERTSFWRFENLWYCNKISPSLDTDSDTPGIQMFLYSVWDKNIFSELAALSRNVEIGSAAHQVCFGDFGDVPGGEASHSSSSSAEGNNECSYIATHHKRLHGVYKNNSTFYFYQ